MLAQHTTGSYAKLVVLDDGKIVQYSTGRNRNLAMLHEGIFWIHESLQDLKDCGYSILPPDLTEMSTGESVKNNGGNVLRILAAQGYGEHRAYLISMSDGAAGSWLTANDIKEYGSIPIPFFPLESKLEVTMKEVCEKFGREVKIKKE